MSRGIIVQTIALENKRGFTLIELVIVIVLIGILAATALPKFANLTTQAYTASNQGVAGGFGAAVSVAHAAWIAQGASGTTLTTAGELNGLSVNANGWPDGGAASITTITAAQCVTVWNGILNNPPTATAGASCATTGCYFVTAAGAVCTYNLGNGAPAHTVTYSIANGAVGST